MRNKTTVRKVLTRAGIFLACMALFMVVSLMMADTAMKHPTEAAAFRSWMQSTRYGWLMWRLALYALLVAGPLENPACAGLPGGIPAAAAAHPVWSVCFYRAV